MKFSAQEEYGLRCLVAIARRGLGGTMTIPELSQFEGLSQPHVAKLMSILRKAEIVKSTRGQIGGYQLARQPKDLVVGEVLAILGGKLYEAGFCERHSGLHAECVHSDEGCLLRGLWGRVQAAVDGVLNDLTLQDIMDSKVADPGPIAYQQKLTQIPVNHS